MLVYSTEDPIIFETRKEIEMLGLTGLCGQNHVERDALSGVILPAQTKTHTPIAHDYLADRLRRLRFDCRTLLFGGESLPSRFDWNSSGSA